jgi:hypothetical protein
VRRGTVAAAGVREEERERGRVAVGRRYAGLGGTVQIGIEQIQI